MATVSLSEDDYRRAEQAWRRFQDQQLLPEDLPALIEAESRHRALLQARLDIEVLDDDEREAIAHGIAFSEAKLAELARLAELHRRAAQLPGYGTPRPSTDLGPRFTAARYVDLVDLAQTLTGEVAIPTGNGRHRIRCPFHQDDDPSLVLFGLGRGWYCFVCQIGGSAVDFVSLHQRLNLVESLLLIEQLCDTRPQPWIAEAGS